MATTKDYDEKDYVISRMLTQVDVTFVLGMKNNHLFSGHLTEDAKIRMNLNGIHLQDNLSSWSFTSGGSNEYLKNSFYFPAFVQLMFSLKQSMQNKVKKNKNNFRWTKIEQHQQIEMILKDQYLCLKAASKLAVHLQVLYVPDESLRVRPDSDLLFRFKNPLTSYFMSPLWSHFSPHLNSLLACCLWTSLLTPCRLKKSNLLVGLTHSEQVSGFTSIFDYIWLYCRKNPQNIHFITFGSKVF